VEYCIGRSPFVPDLAVERLGRFGVWRGYTGFTPEDARELEELGYGTLLDATETIMVV
jgi:hypothetical protein